jgi:GntR family transcriptional regulator / MocR family aminotransferase
VSEDWAGSLDLHVDLPSGGGRRAALERAVREAIRDGRLRPGDRVPSTRALAHDLGLARGTVAEAYAQLAAEGYLKARPGAPTRVAGGVALGEAAAGDGDPARAGVPAAAEPRFTLRPGVPDVSGFPRSAWIAALRRALSSAPDAVLRPGDPRGRAELRVALAAYLGRARGVMADPERIVICAGFTEGLALLCRALRGTGALAMEDPCFATHRAIAHAAGMRVAPLEVDEHGARPDVPPDVAAALLTPAHQFPLGATLAPERRSAFVAWAREHGTLVIEDDYDGEFRYDRQPAGALQGLDPEHVVYSGTASKTLAPALRLGWLVLPERLLEPVLAAKLGAAPALEQLALAELLSGGGYDRHVRRMRQRYRKRRDALLSRLGDQRALGIAAGLHVVVEVASEQDVLARAAEHDLALEPLGPYWHRESTFEGLVVGYAAPPEHAFAAALSALASALP